MRADEILHPQYFTPQDGLYPRLPAEQGRSAARCTACCSSARGTSIRRSGSTGRRPGSVRTTTRRRSRRRSGCFDEDNLSASFSRLGPLVKRFPNSQSVRYHLGLLLAWTGQRDQAIAEFRLARSLGAQTRLGRQADVFLKGLVPNGTKGQ